MKQTAYQIVTDKWDSGKVESDRMQAVYPAEIADRERVCWKIRLWDETGEPGEWSEPEEKDRLELQTAEEELTQNRLREIEERCAAKGLDSEKEKEAYLESVRVKKEKEAEKKRSKEAKALERQEKKLAAMSPEKKARRAQKRTDAEKKALALWEKEARENESYYAEIQASLRS